MCSKCFLILILVIELRSEPDRRVITTLKYSKNYIKPVVVNGEPASIGQIPYIVSIKEPGKKLKKKIVWRNLCGGSIISELKVLTAAHCFEGNNFFYARHPQLLRVVAGDLHNYATYEPNSTSTQWRIIKKLVIHGSFNFPNNDIALLTVNKPWIFGETVNYVIPARKTMDYPRTCMAAGYGRVGHAANSITSDELLLAPIYIIPRRRCSEIWEMNMNTFICSNSLLTDVGRGDSGGPLACKWTLDPVEKRNRDLLVGVVSGKNFDYTTIFTRVSAFHGWIARGGGCKLGDPPIYVPIILALAEYCSFLFL